MKNNLQYFSIALMLVFSCFTGFAQSGLYVQEGTDLFIKSGTIFSADSPVLKPSANLTVTGANGLQRSGTVSHTYPNNYLRRVFQFTNTLPAYSGEIGIYYKDAELNGLSESELTVKIHDGSKWNTYPSNVTRDASNNFVNATGLSNITLNEITLAGECLTKTAWYEDSDGDGFGNPSVTALACSAPAGYVSDNTDCNDAITSVHPDAVEVCDGIDNNCDGTIDEGFSSLYYPDNDGDGYETNVTGITGTTCNHASGYVTNNTDCNDNNTQVHPGATEVCNRVDDDCDGLIDEGLTQYTYYLDSDGDGYGTASTTTSCSSTAPQGYASRGGDCNDNNAAINPGASEVCDGIDNNCNGQIDEGVKTTYYRDANGDGYGNSSVSTQICTAPSGYVANNTDCNDNNATIRPGATEIFGNSLDDNCDGQIDEGCNNKTLISINDATVYESAGTVTLTITLSRKSTGPVTFNYTTVDGTARSKATRNSSADFTAKSGTMTIPAGQQSAALSINIAKDNIQEPTEQFTVNLSKPVNASIGDGTGTVTIQNGSPVTTAAPIVANKNVRSYSLKKQVTGKLSVKVFPNPSANYFTIVTNSNSAQPFIVKVLDLLGRTLETKTGISANGPFQIGHNYRTGVYIIQVIQGSEKVFAKLIKQNK